MSDLDLDPGGLTVVSDIDGLKPYNNQARFDVSRERITDLQMSIVEAFYGDQLELKESPAMTATEVERRWQILQKLLGPTVGRIQSDLLDPMIQRTFNILLRAGQLPEIPQQVIEAAGDTNFIEIKYTGPIPRSQQLERADIIEQWLAGVAQLAELYPEVMDVPDAQSAVREIGQLRGVPAKTMNSDNEAKAKKREREEAMKEQQIAETAAAEGQAMQNLGQGQQAMTDAGMMGDNVIPMAGAAGE